MRKRTFRIRDHRGTYYQGGGFLPRFGATREQAWTTNDGMEAYRVMDGFPLMVLADLVNERDQKCDTTGRRLPPQEKRR